MFHYHFPSKVASNTWNNHLLRLRGIGEMAKPTKDALKRLNYKIGEVFGLNTRVLVKEALFGLPKGIDIVDAKNTFVTFAFVRHPFKRLISLCSDKLPGLKPKQCAKKLIATTKGGYNTDGHFSEQCYQCPFCSMDFDLIGNMDDMSQHLDFLAKTLGIKVRGICPIAHLQCYCTYNEYYNAMANNTSPLNCFRI